MFLAKINETEQLIDLIHEQNSNYIGIMLWIFGFMVTVFVTFFGVQWYLNTKQVKTIKKETEQQLLKTYIIPLEAKVDAMNIVIKSENIRKEMATSLKYLGKFEEKEIEESIYKEYKQYLEELYKLTNDKAVQYSVLMLTLYDVRDKVEELKESQTSDIGLELAEKLYAEIQQQIDDQK